MFSLQVSPDNGHDTFHMKVPHLESTTPGVSWRITWLTPSVNAPSVGTVVVFVFGETADTWSRYRTGLACNSICHYFCVLSDGGTPGR